MPRGQLPRESNPRDPRNPAAVGSHDKTGNEDYVPTSPVNPLPVGDVSVRSELQKIVADNAILKQQNADLLAKLNAGIDTKLTGSVVENKNKIVYDRVSFQSNRTMSSVQPNKYAKGVTISVEVHNIIGTPVNGVFVLVRAVSGGNSYGIYTLPPLKEAKRRIRVIYPGVSSVIDELADVDYIKSGVIPDNFIIEVRNSDSSDGVEYNCTISHSLIL